jgi:hypothetical protein
MTDYTDFFDEESTEGFYGNMLGPPVAVADTPAPTATSNIDTIRARLPELWAEHKANRCQCPACKESHQKQPGRKRDPITGHGCTVGLAQWNEFVAAKNELLELLPHGEPDSYVVGCRCELCAAAHAVGKVPAGVVHGLMAYRKYKCTCDVCRAASAAYRKELRATREVQQRRLMEIQRAEIEALRAALRAARGNG